MHGFDTIHATLLRGGDRYMVLYPIVATAVLFGYT